jgi:hypothetical protein
VPSELSRWTELNAPPLAFAQDNVLPSALYCSRIMIKSSFVVSTQLSNQVELNRPAFGRSWLVQVALSDGRPATLNRLTSV